MEYKKQYDQKELQDLKDWFNSRKDMLPTSLKLDEATIVPDVARAVNQLLEIAELHRTNPTFSGQIYLLYRIKDKIEEGL